MWYIIIGIILGIIYVLTSTANLLFEFSEDERLTLIDDEYSIEFNFFKIILFLLMGGLVVFLWPMFSFALLISLLKEYIDYRRERN